MTPFPETEIMTIKRLEVALRKMDLKLLKDGAYKLHEKYHSGFRFEYLDLLKDISENVSNNNSIPEDIKNILQPTIQDILNNNIIFKEDKQNNENNRVSSLTSLSYNANSEAQTQKMDAFDAFGTKQQEHHSTLTYSQSPFSAQPFKNIHNSVEAVPHTAQDYSIIERNSTSTTQTPQNNYEESQEITKEENKSYETNVITATKEAPKKTKTIGIFYGQDSSNEKAKNITRYRELISKMDDEHSSITEILNLISEINTQVNTNVSELKNVFDQLNVTNNKINLVTNVSASGLINLFEENNYSYSLLDEEEGAKTRILPLYGLSNLFVCKNCSREFLDKNEKLTPLVLQCPQCKSPMFPNFYAALGKDIQFNIEYYNEALVSLANSNIWFIVHPVSNERATNKLLLSALKLNKNIEEIFILDKDINVRENYKDMFQSINPNININTQISALEDFLKLIR